MDAGSLKALNPSAKKPADVKHPLAHTELIDELLFYRPMSLQKPAGMPLIDCSDSCFTGVAD
jgi:hypothetical protein